MTNVIVLLDLWNKLHFKMLTKKKKKRLELGVTAVDSIIYILSVMTHLSHNTSASPITRKPKDFLLNN